MKKIIILFAVIVLVTGKYKAEAQLAVACVNCSTWMSQVGIQIPKEIITAVETGYTAVSTGLSATKGTILDPIANMLKNTVLNQITNTTLNWVRSGGKTSLSGSLFINNPDRFLQNVTNNATRIAINQMQGQNGGDMFTNSVIGAVTANVRNGQLSINAQVPYTLATTIQNGACTDANLSQMALNAIGGGDLTDPATRVAYNQKKSDLYNSLCKTSASGSSGSSANGNNQAQNQQKVTNCFLGDFNCGGWNAFLDMTNTNTNPYAVQAQRQALAVQQAADAKAKAQLDMQNGKGAISQTTCDKTQIDPNSGKSMCIGQTIVTPSSVVSDTMNKSASRGVDTLMNSQNDIFTTFANAAMTALMNGVFSLSYNSSGSGGGSITYNPTTPINTVVASSTNQNDLSVANKTTLAAPLLDKLNGELVEIDTIKTGDGNIIAMLNSYESQVNGLTDCYGRLIALNQTMASDTRVLAGNTLVDARKLRIRNERNSLQAEINSSASTTVAINGVKTTISNTFSTTVLGQIADSISTAITNGTLPAPGTGAQKEATLITERQTNDDDIKNNIAPKINECEQIIVSMNNISQ